MSNAEGRLYAHGNTGTNGTFAVPGDGNGGIHEQVGAARNIVAVNGLTLQLDSTASLAAGQVVITTGGYWGTITLVSSPNITVARWMHHASLDVPGKVPATGTGNLRAFPAGCGLCGYRRVMIEEVHITRAVTAAATLHILDFRMDTANPVFKLDSVVGGIGPFPVWAPSRGPFIIAVSNYTNLNATIYYNPIS